jgi:ectoine hydroxylase-related dioxygenase (phytanoyl-CoA dioxygenase family)
MQSTLSQKSILTSEQINSFWKDGFLSLPAFLDQSSLRQLQDLCDRALRGDLDCGAGDRKLGGLVRQIMHPSRYHKGFTDHAGMKSAYSIAKQLLGCEPEFPFDMIMSKGPGDLHETPWHQDWSYSAIPFAPEGTPIPNTKLQFWVALDDVDRNNGCMQFLRGMHHGLLKQHVVASGDPKEDSRLLALSSIDSTNAVVCPLPAGGCTIHVEGTPHFTGGNLTANRQRRAYIFNLVPSQKI